MPAEMASRKTIGIVVSALLIIVLLLVFTDPWSTVRNEGKQVHLSDPGSVDRILLSDPYDSTLLVREGQQWWLSGHEEVNPVTVQNLLFAAGKLQISSILSDESAAPRKGYREVRFFSDDHLKLGFEFSGENGQYLVRPLGSSKSYYVEVSGYGGLDLSRVFSASPNHYRQHILIDLLPSEICRIDTELPTGEAFRFEQDAGGGITCTPLNTRTVIPDTPMDDLAVRLLFSYFTSIRYEEPSGILKEEMEGEGGPPELAKLSVVPREGEGHTLKIFPLKEEEGRMDDMFRALVLFDNEQEALVVKYIYLDVLMRGLSHYF